MASNDIKSRLVGFKARLIDPTKGWDYLLISLYATLPVLVAWMIGAGPSMIAADGTVYKGYFEARNWVALILIVPVALWIVRTVLHRIAPLSGSEEPPLCAILDETKDRTEFCVRLKRAVFSRSNLLTAFGLSLIVQVVDLIEIQGFYLRGLLMQPQPVPREPDWTVYFVAEKVGLWSNLLLVILAYSLQFLIGGLAFYLILFFLRHNLFFLRSVYQRRKMASQKRFCAIEIDLDDPDDCFGFRKANQAFNVQVLCLFAAGVGTLASRFSNVAAEQSDKIYKSVPSVFSLVSFKDNALDSLFDALERRLLFPDVGQCILPLAWLVLLIVVALPAAVKMLPRSGGDRVPRLIVPYLQEFIAPDKWALGPDPTRDEVSAVARQFARNSFWPTGNNRAFRLFFYSFFVFLVILLPLHFDGRGIPVFVAFYFTLGLIAAGLTGLALKSLEWYLSGIDVRLVDPKAS